MAARDEQLPKGAATACVMCKLPHGYWLQWFDMIETQEPVMGGGWRTVRRAIERPERRFLLAGNAAPFGMAPAAPIAGGYALTFGVPVDLWEHWLDSGGRDTDVFRNGLIKAAHSETEARVIGRENEARKSGLEPLDPTNLPRDFQAKRIGLGQIEKATPGAG